MKSLIVVLIVGACTFVESLPHTQRSDCPGIQYDSECFFSLEKAQQFDAAVQACEDNDAHLAYITSEEMYKEIARSLSSEISKNGWESAMYWIGATYSAQTTKVTFLNGEESSWEHVWFPGFPVSLIHWNKIGWQIDSDLEQTPHGFLNHPASADLIPICQLTTA